MVNSKEIKDAIVKDGKAVAAEAESALSQMIGFFTPRWDKFVTTWNTWTLRKKIVAGVVFAIVGLVVWTYLPSPMRMFGRAWAYMPSRSQVVPVTESDLKTFRTSVLADTVSREDFALLQERVSKLEKEKADIVVPIKPIVTHSNRRTKKKSSAE